MKKLSILLLILCLGISPLTAAENDPARQKLEEAMTFLSGQTALSTSLAMTINVQQNGQPRSITLYVDLTLQGDDKFHAKIKTPQEEAAIISDGETRWIHLITQKEYIEAPAPEERSDLVSMLASGPMGGGSNWLADLLHNNPIILDKANVITTTEAKSILLQYPNFHLDIQLPKDGNPAPLKFNIIPQGDDSPQGEYTIEFAFDNWEFGQPVPDSTFAFTPPEGVTEMVQPGQEPDTSLGTDAPEVTLPLLDGGEIKISDFKNKKVLVLDFWATWCGPCRMAMPIIDEVAAEYKDKDVAVYAVNVNEGAKKIQEFVDKMELTLPIAMDAGKAAQLYHANSIPRTVVIGKNGRIQAVHLGYSPYLKRELTKQIDTLLKGENLVD